MQCVWFFIFLVCQSQAFISETIRDDSNDQHIRSNKHGRNKQRIQFGEGNIQADQIQSQRIAETLPSERHLQTHRIKHTVIIHEEDGTEVPNEYLRQGDFRIKIRTFIDKHSHRFNKKNNVKHGGIIDQALLSETESENNGRIEHRVQFLGNKNNDTNPSVFSVGADIVKHDRHEQTTEPDRYEHFTKKVGNKMFEIQQSPLDTGDTPKTYKKDVTISNQDRNGETKHLNTSRGNTENTSGCTDCPEYGVRERHSKEKKLTYEETAHETKTITEIEFTRHPGHKHHRPHRHYHGMRMVRHGKIKSDTIHEERAIESSGVQIGLVTERSDKKYKHPKFHLYGFHTSTQYNQFKTNTFYKRNTSKPLGAKTRYTKSQLKDAHVAEITDRNSSTFCSVSAYILAELSALVMILNSNRFR